MKGADMRKISMRIVVWLVSMFAVGMWAHAQAPVQPAPPLTPRGVPPGQDEPARIISGNDIGFRVEDVEDVGRVILRRADRKIALLHTAHCSRLLPAYEPGSMERAPPGPFRKPHFAYVKIASRLLPLRPRRYAQRVPARSGTGQRPSIRDCPLLSWRRARSVRCPR